MSCLHLSNQLHELSILLRRTEMRYIKSPDIVTVSIMDDLRKAASWPDLCIYYAEDGQLAWIKRGGGGPHYFDPTSKILPDQLLQALESVKLKWDKK